MVVLGGTVKDLNPGQGVSLSKGWGFVFGF